MSLSGSPGTAMRSAAMPGRSAPTAFASPSSSAALVVAAMIAVAGVMPCFTINSNSSALRPCLETPASVPKAILTPAGTDFSNALPVISSRHITFSSTAGG